MCSYTDSEFTICYSDVHPYQLRRRLAKVSASHPLVLFRIAQESRLRVTIDGVDQEWALGSYTASQAEWDRHWNVIDPQDPSPRQSAYTVPSMPSCTAWGPPRDAPRSPPCERFYVRLPVTQTGV